MQAEQTIWVRTKPSTWVRVMEVLMVVVMGTLLWSLLREDAPEPRQPQVVETGDTLTLRVHEQAFLGNPGIWLWVSTDPGTLVLDRERGVVVAALITRGTQVCAGTLREAVIRDLLVEDAYRMPQSRQNTLRDELAELTRERPDSLCAVVRVVQ